MKSIKGIYHNGIIEPFLKPHVDKPTEVIILFPDQTKSVKKIGGLFKNTEIDYAAISRDIVVAPACMTVMTAPATQWGYILLHVNSSVQIL